MYERKEKWMPGLGDEITPAQGAILCSRYELHETAERVANNLCDYKSFVFDGCSMVPDRALAALTQDSGLWVKVIYNACFPHDLGYAYGQIGDKAGQKHNDMQFYFNLLACGVGKNIARIMLRAVRLGGAEWLCMSFSWGFADRRRIIE